MRTILFAAAIFLFSAPTIFHATDAQAIVCANGVKRAGCAGPNAAVVVKKPPPAVVCKTVVVNGVKVRKCS